MKRLCKGQELSKSRESDQQRKRSVWRKEEDKLLLQLATKHDTKDWTLIANEISKIAQESDIIKSPKQCRERWHNRVNPSIKQSEWTQEEENRFFELYQSLGPKWSDIALHLPGRTDNTAKNFFFCKLRKIARRIKKGIVADDMKRGQTEIEHTIYLLNYFIATYFPESKRQYTKGQKDKYVESMIQNEALTAQKTQLYVKEYMAAVEAYKKIHNPPLHPISDTEESLSKAPSYSPAKLPSNFISCLQSISLNNAA